MNFQTLGTLNNRNVSVLEAGGNPGRMCRTGTLESSSLQGEGGANKGAGVFTHQLPSIIASGGTPWACSFPQVEERQVLLCTEMVRAKGKWE